MRLLSILPAGTAAAGALFGGALFAFSSFVLPALQRLPDAEAIAAMQAINVQAPRSLLMVPMGALVIGSLGCAGVALATDVPHRGLWLAGAALGLAAVGITVAGNVPLNDHLATVPATAGSAQEWADFVQSWGRLNHLRVVAALASAVLLARAAASTT